jgi:DNA-binding transcriptional LysR family regulator
MAATDLSDLTAFVAVVRSGGFREASRTTGSSASSLSEAVRNLETRLGVRLLNRSPTGPLIVRVGAATDLAVDAAVAGSGVIFPRRCGLS